MSLINQVLKDLERRHAGEVRGAARAVRPLPEGGGGRRLWIALASVATLCTAGGAAWWYLSPALARNAPLSGEAAPAKPTLPGATAPSSAFVSQTTPSASTADNQLAPASATVGPSPSTDERTEATVPSSARASTPEIAGLPQPARVTERGQDVGAKANAPAGRLGMHPARAAAQMARTADAAPATASAPAKTSRDSAVKLPERTASSKPESDAAQGGAEIKPGSAAIDKQPLPPTERERAEAEFRGALAALASGDSNEAQNRLRAALIVDPLADKARQALLGIYIEQGRREDAAELLEERLRLDPRAAVFALALARLQLERGVNSEALATLQRSLPYGERSADYQAMLANALGRMGEHKQAAEHFQMAAQLAPRNPVWLMGWGIELRADNRNSEARAAFQRARESGGLNPQLASFVDRQLRELK